MCKAKAFCSNSSFLEYAVICHIPPHQRNPNQDFYLEVLALFSSLHYDPCGKSFSALENGIELLKMCMLFPEPFLCSLLQTKQGMWYDASSAPNIVFINFCPSYALLKKGNTWVSFPTLIIPIKSFL